MSGYVSDEFKTVARRVFKRFVGSEIENVCPKDKPLCKAVVHQLAQAFGAAVVHDQAALKQGLSGFFVASSTNALLQAALDDVLDSPQLAPLAPMVSCLSGVLSGQAARSACSLNSKDQQVVLATIQSFRQAGTDCAGMPVSPVCAQRAKVLADLKAGASIDPEDAVQILAALFDTDAIGRPDVAIYFRQLASFLSQGTDAGLFLPAQAFLLDDHPISSFKQLIEYDRASHPGWDIWSPTQDDTWVKALDTCKQPRDAWQRWADLRDHHGFVSELRARFIRGQPADLGPLRDLLAYRTCADPAASQTIALLRTHVRFAIAPLEIQQALSRWSVPGLAAAAVLDYLHDGDETALDARVRQTLLYGVAALAAQHHNARTLAAETPAHRITPASWIRVSQARSSCEVRAAAALLSVSTAPATTCFSFADGKEMPIPAAPAPAVGAPTTDWLVQHRHAILGGLLPLLDAGADGLAETVGLTQPNARTLGNALDQLTQGSPRQARQMLVRLGVDLMASRVDGFAAKLVGGDVDACIRSTRSTTIFSGIGAACATHLLLVSAYRPIADYYWQTGANPESSSDVATSVYRNLLESPALNATPIILSVGLGGSYVLGSKAVWGNNGYGAATVIDKFGLAFYKYSSDRWRFETGPFVGGFLDALVRTATGDGKAERYWLAGYTVGFTRMSGADLGFQIHAGGALPFRFDETDHYGFVVGAALAVPFDTVFDKEE